MELNIKPNRNIKIKYALKLAHQQCTARLEHSSPVTAHHIPMLHPSIYNHSVTSSRALNKEDYDIIRCDIQKYIRESSKIKILKTKNIYKKYKIIIFMLKIIISIMFMFI